MVIKYNYVLGVVRHVSLLFLVFIITAINAFKVGSTAITPNGTTRFVVVPERNEVQVFDQHTGKLSQTIAGFNQPQTLVISPNGMYVYVANRGNNSVAIIDVATCTISDVITDPSINAPGLLTISRDGQTLRIKNGNNTTTLVDIATNRVNRVQ